MTFFSFTFGRLEVMAALRSRLHHSLLRIYVTAVVRRERCLTKDLIKDIKRYCIRHITATSRYCSFIPIKPQDEISNKSSSIDPFTLVEKDISYLTDQVKQEFACATKELRSVVEYYFDGQGKSFRPMVVLLMSQACNHHNNLSHLHCFPSQNKIAMISEMIHTASLIHDDVIDAADTRRGKTSVNILWGQRKSILAGDYILSVASMTLARLRNEQIVTILSQVIEDLVRGEFMQLGSKENENERFSHYLMKTFKKTASLLANSCKAVAILANSSDDVTEIAFQYGRNIGIAFQLIDDLLDFISCDVILGKPSAADLKLGLATAPVLFAAQQYPELNPLIMRRFSLDGDVATARHLVAKSDGVEQTRRLAVHHGKEAVRQLNQLTKSEYQKALLTLVDIILNRKK